MVSRLIALSALAALLFGGGAAAQELAGDPQEGERIFQKCRACHRAEPAVNRVGPTLYGVLGRAVASVSGFDYSEPMLAWAEGRTWTPELLNVWLENPRDVVPGTHMTFAGLRDPEDRADVIAYLRSVPE